MTKNSAMSCGTPEQTSASPAHLPSTLEEERVPLRLGPVVVEIAVPVPAVSVDVGAVEFRRSRRRTARAVGATPARRGSWPRTTRTSACGLSTGARTASPCRSPRRRRSRNRRRRRRFPVVTVALHRNRSDNDAENCEDCEGDEAEEHANTLVSSPGSNRRSIARVAQDPATAIPMSLV